MKKESSNDLVSLVVPVYNVELYLQRCITSLLNQSYKNVEIILVDDGSTDNSGVLCDQISINDPRIKVVHKSNQGLGEARNTGLDYARGEWICFVDSDDYVDRRYVELLLKAVLSENTLIAQCMYERGTQEQFSYSNKEISIKKYNLDDYYRYCYVTEGHSIYSCWNYIYHRSVFKKVKFMDIRHTEDVPFIQEVLWGYSNQGISIVNQVLYYWFQRSGSIMNRKADLNLLNQIKAYEIVLDFWRDKGRRFIYDMFFDTYYNCLIDDYLRLVRDAPDEKKKYDFLINKIKQHYATAVIRNHGKLLLDRSDFDLIDYLKDRRLIVYGYGDNGRKIIPWLIHYNVSIEEIWDMQADGGNIRGIIFNKMHSINSVNLTVLLTIEDANLSILIKQQLEKLGIIDVIEKKAIESFIRKRNYKEYLPFLYE